jgi:hypothetical protein
MEGSSRDLILVLSCNFLDALRKITKTLIQNNRSLVLDLYSGPPDYGVNVLTIPPRSWFIVKILPRS